MPDPGRPSPLDHLPRLYALAQTLAPDAEAAARLVDATYRRAAQSDDAALRAGDRLALFRLMAMLHARGGSAQRPQETSAAKAPLGFQQRAARRLLRRHLPAAYAALAPPDRLLLALCKVERLSCADAGHVLGLSPDAACGRLDRAQAALWHHVHAQAGTPAARRLLGEALPPGSLRPALHALVESDFATPPAALASALQAGWPSAQAEDAAEPPPAAAQAPRLPKRRHSGARRAAAANGPGSRTRRMMLALVLILATGLVGYLASAVLERTPEVSLLALSAQHDPDRAVQAFQPRSPAEAEQLVERALGRRLAVPAISGAALTSVRIAELAPGARVPVFLFENTAEGTAAAGPIRVYAYTYALLDRFAERLRLSSDLLREIAAEGAFEIRRVGEAPALVWRDRATIFVAFPADGSAEALRQRISGERGNG